MSPVKTAQRALMHDGPAGREPLVAVILVNWNGWRDAIHAHRSLQLSQYANWRLIIVDNASTDQSREQLARLTDRTELIASPRNLGFAGGCNLGLSAARAAGADYIFLLNCDAAVTPPTVGQLVCASRALSDKAVLGAVVRYADGSGLQFFGSRTSVEWGRPEWYKAPADLNQLEASLVASDFILGATLFAPAPLFDAVGDFDERYFLNFEETDWCYRARAAGFGCYVVSQAVIEHQGGASIGPGEGPLQTYFLRRNQLLFAERHGSRSQHLRVIRRSFRYLLWCVRRDLWNAGRPQLRLQETTSALALAIRDYLLRRFYDCPPRVRRWAKAYAARSRPAER